MKKKWWYFFSGGLLSGVLTSLSIPEIYGFIYLMPIALIPFLWVINQTSLKKDYFIASIGYSFSTNLLCFFWFATSLSEMWKFPLIVSSLVFLPIALFSEFPFFIIACLRGWLLKKSNSLKVLFAISLIYATVEFFSRPLFPNDIGVTFYGFKYLKLAFDISGASLFNALFWFTNETILKIYSEKQFRFSRIGSLVLIFGILFSYNLVRINQYAEMEKNTKVIKGLIIQPNFHHSERDSARLGFEPIVEKVLSRHFTMSEEGLKKHPDTEFIIWPETTYPFYFQSYSTVYQEEKEISMYNFLKDEPITLFFGSFGKVGEPSIIKNNLYSISHYTSKPEVNRFEKTVLFPFGEYIPGSKYFPILKKIFPKANTPTPSLEPTVLPIGKDGDKINIGAAICYEGLFADLFRKQALKGTDLIINITNESFFGSFGEPQLNLLHTSIRAIENHLPVLRSANTGISAAITAQGTIINRIPMDKTDSMFVELPLVNEKYYPPSWFLKYGDWIAHLGILILVAMIIWRLRRRNDE